MDRGSAGALAQFWAAALGYVPAPPPVGFASWEAWSIHNDVPREEWDDGAAIADPDGAAPGISFLRVPEGKTVKNRLHLDLPVSGGRHLAADVREGRIRAEVERLRYIGTCRRGRRRRWPRRVRRARRSGRSSPPCPWGCR